MNWQDSTRVGQPGHGSFPASKRSSRSRLPEEGTRSRSQSTPSETTQRKPPLVILGSIWRALGFSVGIHQVRRRFYEAEEHPGWNISDEIDLPPRGECRYLVELVSGQTASVHVGSTHPVAIAICDDDDYDSLQDGESWVGPDSVIVSPVCAESSNSFGFRTLRTGVYDVIFTNPGDQSARVAICITAPPARQTANCTAIGPRAPNQVLNVTIPSKDGQLK